MTDPDPPAGLKVGFVPGVTLTKWTRIWSERFPRVRLEVVEVAQREQRDSVTDGRVDLCFVRLPLSPDQLHVIPLYEEVPVVVVPKDHPISLFEEVTQAELADENVLEDEDTSQAVDLVAGGAGVLLVPHSIARSHSRRDLVYRTISDAPPTQISLAWRQDNPNELIEDFIGIVRGRTVNSSRSARPAPEATKKPAKTKAAKPTASRGQPSRRRRGRG
jgi:DNA-binding transcriptional LysR family regulator